MISVMANLALPHLDRDALEGIDAALSRHQEAIDAARRECEDTGLTFEPGNLQARLHAARAWLMTVFSAIHRAETEE